uniref:Master replication protein n=1 Tax=Banana bunchy top virus TaxID=12585 RepID=A0A3Q8UB21_BBTV|nr:assistant replication initiation protein [Banana bunchy top virus]
MASSKWCFTLNYSSAAEREDFLSRLKEEDVHYAVVGDEVAPSSGQKHLQGYLSLKKGIRLGGLKKRYSSKAHWEIARGTDEQNRGYCSKETLVLELGTPVVPRSNKRKLMERYREDPEELKMDDPSKYRRCLAADSIEKARNNSKWVHELREWQNQLIQHIEGVPDDRSIIWVYGPAGGEGKSTFARYLSLKPGWGYINGGKTSDMMHIITMDADNHWIIDIPRSNSEYLNYGVIEQIKNRVLINTKYEPCVIRKDGQNVHVIVMANVLPDYCKISEDRIKIINC